MLPTFFLSPQHWSSHTTSMQVQKRCSAGILMTQRQTHTSQRGSGVGFFFFFFFFFSSVCRGLEAASYETRSRAICEEINVRRRFVGKEQCWFELDAYGDFEVLLLYLLLIFLLKKRFYLKDCSLSKHRAFMPDYQSSSTHIGSR